MSDAQIASARARASAARNRLADALAALKQRLLPRTLARNLAQDIAAKGQEAAQAGVDVAKARPGVAIGAAAVAALLLARKPIARAIGIAKTGEPPETQARAARSPDNTPSEDRP